MIPEISKDQFRRGNQVQWFMTFEIQILDLFRI